jgi:hypothetical protein
VILSLLQDRDRVDSQDAPRREDAASLGRETEAIEGYAADQLPVPRADSQLDGELARAQGHGSGLLDELGDTGTEAGQRLEDQVLVPSHSRTLYGQTMNVSSGFPIARD